MALHLPWEEELKSVLYILMIHYKYVRIMLIIIFAVAQACKSLAKIVIYRKLEWIYTNFARFWRCLTSDSQLRWVMCNEE